MIIRTSQTHIGNLLSTRLVSPPVLRTSPNAFLFSTSTLLRSRFNMEKLPFKYKIINTCPDPSSSSAIPTALPSSQKFLAQNSSHSQAIQTSFGTCFSMQNFTDLHIHHKRLVFFGEIHGTNNIVYLQTRIQHAMMLSLKQNAKLHVLMEHFTFEMDDIIKDFIYGHQKFEQLLQDYVKVGGAGHDLIVLRPLLEHARLNSQLVSIVPGFIPRSYAKALMQKGERHAIQLAQEKDYIPSHTMALDSSEFHYSFFESLITGRSLHDPNLPPSDKFAQMFKAQVLKDVAMAYAFEKLFKTHPSSNDKYLLIAGNGHMAYHCGVPERVLSLSDTLGPSFPDSTSKLLLISHPIDPVLDIQNLNGQQLLESLQSEYGSQGSYPADFLYVFEDDDDQIQQDEQEPSQPNLKHDAKQETKLAYEKVGDTAHVPGNLKKAKAIMNHLGYTEQQFLWVGQDAYNYQGVGNPHRFAHIKPGERVLDLGSGLGIDSFIAAHYTGPTGSVTGIDLSNSQVFHANRRAEARKVNHYVRFVNADIENLPFPSNCFDVVISNGAFCLVPDKKKAFQEIFRVLSSGGRMSVCTSTVRTTLEQGINWPLCMRMFICVDQLLPICKSIGFCDINVDTSNHSMQFELPDDVEQDQPHDQSYQQRQKIHVGSAEFKHLADYNMNELCAVVTVIAHKP